MSCNQERAIDVRGIGKFFEMYAAPSHRLLQMLFRGRKQFYRPFWALRDVSFDVRRGECVGIIGRNGAGKSTLLQIITGTLAPSQGEVTCSGRVAALLELGSGFNPEFTGRENVYLNASILGLSRREIEERYDDIVAFADLGEFIDQPVKSYSSGMTVRLAFAVIVHVNADILIVDEALAVGDAFFTQKCMRFLRDFMQEHTVLFVSHDIPSVTSLCNRAILLEHGSIKCMGSPKEVTEVYLQDMYESMQGKGAPSAAGPQGPPVPDGTAADYRDMRLDFINATNLRNDIQVFRFNEQGAAFGKGGACIEDAALLDTNGNRLAWIVGGEMVTLHVVCRAKQFIFSPIVGFYIKDRHGQTLTGDNTYLSFMERPLRVPAGSRFEACFTFRIPVLASGDYSFAIAVAEGTQAEHVQHEWRHDALVISSVSSSIPAGLMGIPMHEIRLDLVED